jgi:predicted ATPase/GAF domain-containing protein
MGLHIQGGTVSDLADTRIIGELRRDAELTLSRGEDAQGRPVLLLAPASERPLPATLARLRHEFRLKGMLSPDWAVMPLTLSESGGRLVLVLDDGGWEPLAQVIGRQPADLERRLTLAVAAAEALSAMHGCGLIHKDISSAHLLVELATSTVRITGFGVASRILREQQHGAPGGAIVGSLPYMAPEQTGRMNRSIDSRSDLYSLGVVLYELFCGRLPFNAVDPMEWVHCHIARQPQRPDRVVAEIPSAVADIIMKLLAKTAEDRYQTASGLAADLSRCLDEWRKAGRVSSFPLAEADFAGRLIVPETLYGREQETRLLIDTFERVAGSGTPELVLVSGYSGVGKSALVNQIHAPMVERRGLYAFGKFDLLKRDVPYATFAQAFSGLIRQILSMGDAKSVAWRTEIQDALGSNAQLIIDLIPQLEHLIGSQPAVAELPPNEAAARLLTVFRRFLLVFARPERALVLFLDDLQWIDGGSLRLMEHLLTHPDVHHLLIIGAYRDNEVGAAHPLVTAIENIRKGERPVADVILFPLLRDELGRLVADALQAKPLAVTPLVAMVHDKTGGNPFFAIQFLTALIDDQLLTYDHGQGRWTWDMVRIRDRGFTDNVIDLMALRLGRLPEAVQQELRRIACLGNSVPLATLAMVYDRSEDSVLVAVEDSLRAGFLLHSGNRLIFAHDRVQEAAYGSIPEDERPALHLHIGRRMVGQMEAADIEAALFEVAHQLNRGVALLTEAGERDYLARLNKQAGLKAKASAAFALASSYFSQARDLTDDDIWTRDHTWMFGLLLELAECEYLAGNQGAASDLFAELLYRADSGAQQASAWRLRFRMFMTAGKYADAVSVAVKALAHFGLTCPDTDEASAKAIEAERVKLSQLLEGRAISEMASLPECRDDSIRALIGVIADAIPAVYHVGPQLYPFLGLAGINLSLQHGVTEDSCAAFSGYSASLVGRFEDISTAFAFSGQALDLGERFGNLELRGSMLFRHGYFVTPWRLSIDESVAVLDECFQTCLETGNLIYACYVADYSAWLLFEKGLPLDAMLARIKKFTPFARNTRISWVLAMIRLQELFLAGLAGEQLKIEDGVAGKDNEANTLATVVAAAHGHGIAFYHVVKQITPYLLGRYDEALAAAETAAAMAGKIASAIIESSHHLYAALTLAALYPSVSPERQRDFAKRLTEHRRKLRLWAESCPETHLPRHLLVEAEAARLEGRTLDSLRLHEEAIASARRQGQLHCEGIANERAAHLALECKMDSAANTYLLNARYAFERWGAMAKVAQLDRIYPHLSDSARAAGTEAASGFRGDNQGLDLMTVIKAQQAVSSEIVLDKLIAALLRIVVEHAGADRGLLLLPQDKTHIVAAEARTQGDTIVVSSDGTPVSDKVLPMPVFQYVVRSRDRVLLDNAGDGTFDTDGYAARSGVKSVLCLPVITHGKLTAILYLENHLAAGAFTRERVAVLDMLASQASISLENATLYAEMEERVRDRTHELAQTLDLARAKSDQVVTLLDNSGQGFLSFGEDLVIGGEYSRACEDMLGAAPAGYAIDQLLWRSDKAKAKLVRDVVAMVMKEKDPLRIKMILGLLPKETLRGTKTLEIQYKYIGCGYIMLVMTDVTEERRLLEKVAIERRHLEMIVSAVTDGHDFFDTVDAVRDFVRIDLGIMLRRRGSAQEILREVYRHIHTFKGLLNQFNFTALPEALHHLESRLDVLRTRGADVTVVEIEDEARSVDYMALLDYDLSVLRGVLGQEFLESGTRIMLSEEQARRLKRLAMNLLAGRLVDVAAPEIRFLLQEIGALGKISIKQSLASYDLLVQRIAQRCEKEIAPLVVDGDEVMIEPALFSPFLRSLGHVFRNAVDHGIETPDERVASEKDETGTISCAVRDLGRAIEIVIADDGAGIDRAALRQSAMQMLDLTGVAQLPDDEILDLVFADGLSTRTGVTQTSGRGVGLAAVKTATETLGGNVRIESTVGVGTRFIFTLANPESSTITMHSCATVN